MKVLQSLGGVAGAASKGVVREGGDEQGSKTSR